MSRAKNIERLAPQPFVRKSNAQCQREAAERIARHNQYALNLQAILDTATRKRLGHL